MKKKLLILILLSLSYFAFGCATGNKQMYYWGNYSSSLYKYKKAPNNETLDAHKQALVKIIEESKKEDMRVPPGVYCEYGYILMQEGKNTDAVNYFDLEEQTYPESKTFTQTLRAKFDKGLNKGTGTDTGIGTIGSGTDTHTNTDKATDKATGKVTDTGKDKE